MKNFKRYLLIWVILLLTFNAVSLLVRFNLFNTAPGASFWLSWLFVNLAFCGNLACAWFAFQADNAGKLFYNLPLVTVSRTALIAMTAVSSVMMAIPSVPAWLAAVICILILAFNAVAVVKSAWAADAVAQIDEKVKTQTSYIRSLTLDADRILSAAESEAVRTECRKVYEAVRYSDPVSSPDLSVDEAKITVKMDELASAVEADDAEKTAGIADELLRLLRARNDRCKMLKG